MKASLSLLRSENTIEVVLAQEGQTTEVTTHAFETEEDADAAMKNAIVVALELTK